MAHATAGQKGASGARARWACVPGGAQARARRAGGGDVQARAKPRGGPCGAPWCQERRPTDTRTCDPASGRRPKTGGTRRTGGLGVNLC
eukprot:9605880-Lingulodinium_polyedra.AAC.1